MAQKKGFLSSFISSFLKPYWLSVLVVILLSIPVAGGRVLIAQGTKILTDEILIGKDERALLLMPLVAVIFLTIYFFARFFHLYCMRAVATRIIQKLRSELYSHILRFPFDYFTRNKTGNLLSRVTVDVQQLNYAIEGLSKFICEPLVFIFVFIYIFTVNWKLALLTSFILPLMGFFFRFTGKRLRHYSLKVQESLGTLSSNLSETFTGMHVVKSFTLEPFMNKKFAGQNRELTRRSLKSILVGELVQPGMEWIAGMSACAVLFYGGYAVFHGTMSPGDVIAFFFSLVMLANSIRSLGNLNVRLQHGLAALERIGHIFYEKLDVVDTHNALSLSDFHSAIEFKDVCFSYGESQNAAPVLHNFSLKINKGEMVALVGASGVGKSTILNLLLRFFHPNSGSITIDGVDIRDYKVHDLRRQISIVTQNIFLFHDSIRNNISLGNGEGSSEESLVQALQLAQGWSFVNKLPHKLDTIVGEQGQKLSAGERQRLSIVRALLKNSPILLLDEATSSLDTENERLVQRAVDNLMKERTVLIVAHRLSTIRNANRIIYIQNGIVLEEGSHGELMKKNGAYAHALSLQEGF